MKLLPLLREKLGLAIRPGQDRLTEELISFFAHPNQRQLVAEAPPGTGKSLAYATAGLETEGRKLFVITATKSLQSQLVDHDLAKLGMVDPTLTIAVLKGLSNYVCQLKTEAVSNDGDDNIRLSENTTAVQVVHETSATNPTFNGDRIFLPKLRNSAWADISTTSEDCLRRECPFFQTCYYQKALQAADFARVVVANHAVFVYATKFRGITHSSDDILVVDEGHKFPESVRGAYTETFSKSVLQKIYEKINFTTETPAAFQAFANKLKADKTTSYVDVEFFNKHAKHLRDCLERDEQELAKYVRLIETMRADNDDEDDDDASEAQRRAQIKAYKAFNFQKAFRRIQSLRACLSANFIAASIVYNGAKSDQVEFIPKSVKSEIRALIADWKTLFISATINDQEFVAQIPASRIVIFPSPFSHEDNAILCIPEIPPPKDERWEASFLAVVRKTVDTFNGHTLVLCTSYRMVRAVSETLVKQGRRVLAQEEGTPVDDYVRAFAKQPQNTVIVGTSVFWTGVDVPGSVLRAVIIDKLPFPVEDAYVAYMKTQPDNFSSHAIPLTTRQLRQGVGRLLRRETDFGCIVMCDARLLAPWARSMLRALPKMTLHRDLGAVLGATKAAADAREVAARDARN